MRDLGLDLHGLPGQLGEDLLAQQHILSRFQLHVPGLRTCAAQREAKDQPDHKQLMRRDTNNPQPVTVRENVLLCCVGSGIIIVHILYA